ncbi:MAG TPA: hypothetical protein VGI81_15765, partial [Tepidisphaeraceae bacterium]
PAGSVDALAAGMKRALSASRDELVQMGRAGADAVAGEYNLPTEVAKLALLFTRSGRRCDKISQC